MKLQFLPKLVHAIDANVKKNSGLYLTILGGVCTVAAVVTAGITTRKVDKIIQEKKEENPAVSKLELFKVAAPYYIPTALLTFAAVIGNAGSSDIYAKQAARMTSAYALAVDCHEVYKKKVAEEIGEKKEKLIEADAIKERLDQKPIVPTEIIETGTGEHLCYDPFCDRYFRSNAVTIERAINRLNARRMSSFDDTVSLKDFYEEIDGLGSPKLADYVGWGSGGSHGGEQIEPQFTTVLTKDDVPCLVLGFYPEPRYDYME